MKRIVILSGAGISAESGLKTFRDSDGLWENHNVYDVATPEAFERDPELVLNFYNERRHQVLEAKPNQAHLAFGEAVPMMEEVIPLVEMADILLVIGTSLAVYPAAGLVNYAPPYSKKYYIDPQGLEGMKSQDFKVISKKACEGVPKLIKKLME